MLQAFEISRFLEDMFNEDKNTKATNRKTCFVVHTSVAGYRNARATQENNKQYFTNGILNVEPSSSNAIIPNFVNPLIVCDIQFAIPYGNKGENIKSAEQIITSVIGKLNGKKVKLGRGEAAFSFGLPTFPSVSNVSPTGNTATARITFDVDYNEGAVSSIDEKVFLDDIELPVLNFRTVLRKSGATNNISGIEATQSLAVQQTREYHITLPYQDSNAGCVKLRSNVANGRLNQIYVLKTYDGVTLDEYGNPYTEFNPMVRTVTLFNAQEIQSDKPNVVAMNYAFHETDRVEHVGVKYYMAVIDTPFDGSTQNSRMFEDNINPLTDEPNNLTAQENQRLYYEEKVKEQGGFWKQIKAANLNNLTTTQQVYFNDGRDDIDEVQGPALELTTALQKNFAIIKVMDWDRPNKEQVRDYFYYFVNSATVGSGKQIIFDLQMDVTQSYLEEMVNATGVVMRAHLNRWLPVDTIE